VFETVKLWAGWMRGPSAEGRLRRRLAGIADILRRVGAMTDEPPPPSDPAVDVVERVVEDACAGCSLYRQCWEAHARAARLEVAALVARAERQRVGPIHLGTYLAARCIRQERLTDVANRVAAAQRQVRRDRRELQDMRDLTRLQLEAVSDLLAAMAVGDDAAGTAPPRRSPLAFAVGIAGRPRRPGDVSGDTPLVRRLPDGRFLVGLSDGMGTGAAAARESATAVSLAADMVAAGFSQRMAVQAVNTALLLQARDETFATLDLVVLDLGRRQMELVKLAAAPSFVRRGGQVRVLRGSAPPVGILRDVAVEPLYNGLEPGDVLVLVSDGVLGPPETGGEDRLVRYLADMPVAPADLMAQTLLALMLDGRTDTAGTLRDDALIMVLTVGTERVGTPFVHIGEQVVGEWLRVTPAGAPRGRRRREGRRDVG
jgi:stage II sporulation protein E